MANPTKRTSEPLPTLTQGQLMTGEGRYGLKRSGGYIYEEFSKDLYGRKAAQKYREMRDNEPVIGAMVYAVTNLARAVEWTIQPKDEDNQDDVKAAEFVQEEFDQLEDPWGEVVDQAMEMLVFGWALAEIVYRRREDGKLGWKGWYFRAQESLDHWVFDEATDTPLAMIQRPPSDYTTRTIHLERSILFRTTSRKNNPEGWSLLRNCYRPWFYKSRLEEIEAIGIERDLAGMPVMRIPIEYMAADAPAEKQAFYAECQRVVRNIKADEQSGLVLPSDKWQGTNGPTSDYLVDFELLSSQGTRATDANAVIERYARQIAMCWLADFLFLGQGATGSFALSSDKTELFAVALGAYTDRLARAVENQAFRRLLDLNSIKGQVCLHHSDFEKQNLVDFSNAIGGLVKAGVISVGPKTEAWARAEFGLPEDDEPYVDPTLPQQEGEIGTQQGELGLKQTEVGIRAKEQELKAQEEKPKAKERKT